MCLLSFDTRKKQLGKMNILTLFFFFSPENEMLNSMMPKFYLKISYVNNAHKVLPKVYEIPCFVSSWWLCFNLCFQQGEIQTWIVNVPLESQGKVWHTLALVSSLGQNDATAHFPPYHKVWIWIQTIALNDQNERVKEPSCLVDHSTAKKRKWDD